MMCGVTSEISTFSTLQIEIFNILFLLSFKYECLLDITLTISKKKYLLPISSYIFFIFSNVYHFLIYPILSVSLN